MTYGYGSLANVGQASAKEFAQAFKWDDSVKGGSYTLPAFPGYAFPAIAVKTPHFDCMKELQLMLKSNSHASPNGSFSKPSPLAGHVSMNSLLDAKIGEAVGTILKSISQSKEDIMDQMKNTESALVAEVQSGNKVRSRRRRRRPAVAAAAAAAAASRPEANAVLGCELSSCYHYRHTRS